jgi:uncharacterized DUF497 family protein
MELNGRSIQGFDWDQHNSLKIQKKHGILPEQVEFVFLGGHGVHVLLDLAHSSEQETRFFGIGFDADRRSMIVVFTLREVDGQCLVRPISARRMHLDERGRYDEKTT